jgi:phage shock protein A
MSLIGWIVLGVVVVLVLAALSPPARRLFKAIGAYGGAQADNAAESIQNADALGVYRTQIANAVDNGKNANKVVETAAKQLVSLDNQIADDLKEQTRLTNRLQAVVDKGDPNKTAAKYAADLARVEEHLKTNQDQRAIAQAQYDENLKLVERYEREINNARKDAEDMGFQLAQSEAEKNLYQMTAALKDKLNLGELAQARRRVQDQINTNKGATMAARDLSRQGRAEDEDADLERNAAAEAVLARFQKGNAGSSSPTGSGS